MCKGHVEEKSLLYVCEIHDYYNIDEVTYVVNLYKRYEETPLLKKNRIYIGDTKLLARSRIKIVNH